MLVGGGVNKKELKISNEMDLNIFMLINYRFRSIGNKIQKQRNIEILGD